MDEDDMAMARVNEEESFWLDRWKEDGSVYHVRWKRSYSSMRSRVGLY